MKFKSLGTAVLAAALSVAASFSQAATFDTIWSFGDSLTDCCVFGPFTGTNNPANVPGTGDPDTTWTKQLANKIGATHEAHPNGPTNQPIHNYAVGGAQAGQNNILPALDLAGYGNTGFRAQVDKFQAAGNTFGTNDLVTIWVGTNDISPQINTDPAAGLNPSIPVGATTEALARHVTGNIRAGISQMVGLGAQNILVLSPFDMAQSAFTFPDPTAATAYSVAIRNMLMKLGRSDANIFMLDMVDLLKRTQDNAASFGFTGGIDGYTPCNPCTDANRDMFIFSDGIHLTTAMNGVIADAATSVLDGQGLAPVPLPASSLLLIGGLAGIGALRRMRKAV